MKGTAWYCVTCKTILGFVDEKKEVLRIKYKDFYCFIKGGEVTILCRRCGTMNTASSIETK